MSSQYEESDTDMHEYEENDQDELMDFIIDSVEKRRFLYDKSSEWYAVLTKKEKDDEFYKIAYEVFQSLGISMTGEAIKSLWKDLKKQFADYHDSLNAKQRSGMGYEPDQPWPYYNKLLFLKNHVSHREVVSSINTDANQADKSKCDEPGNQSIWLTAKKTDGNKKQESHLTLPSTSKDVMPVPQVDSFAQKRVEAKNNMAACVETLTKTVVEESKNLLRKPQSTSSGDDYKVLVCDSMQGLAPADVLKCFKKIMLYLEEKKKEGSKTNITDE